jgi:hypothetical protein
MRFEAIPVQAVKSISQRNLAVHWQTLHARLGLPRFADFSPGNRAHDPRQLLVWTVDEQNGAFGYRHLYGGAYVFEAFGLDATAATVPERLRGVSKTGLDECVASASMIYMSIATSDPAGHSIACERLLLPFGSGGKAVTHIVASLQLVSVEGTFERRTIVQQFEREAEVTFCGRIPPATRLMPHRATTRGERSRSA